MSPDNRNLLAAMVFSFAILIGWQVFFLGPQQDAAREQAKQEALFAETQTGDDGEIASNITGTTSTNALGGAAQTQADGASTAVRIAIETPKLTGSFTTTGGRIDDLLLLDYEVGLDTVDDPVRLLRPTDGASPYFMELGWVSDNPDQLMPSSKTIWQTQDKILTPESPVTLHWDNGKGLIFEREIAVDDEYLFTITDKVRSTISRKIIFQPYGLVRRFGTPDTSGIYILHEGPIGVFDEKLNEENYSGLKKAGSEGLRFTPENPGGWIGITDKYWLTALIPEQTETVSYGMRWLGGGQDRYQTDFLGAPLTLSPGEEVVWSARLFAGAKKLTVLDDYSEKYAIANFDLAIDFGWFYFLTKPFFYALNFLYHWLGNFGLAIICFTAMMRLVLYPLASKSYRSMGKMRILAPKIKEMRERFGDDRTKLNQEMMALYRQEKVNPAAGCLPILLQIPIFFALYKVLYVSIEMRHAPFYGWIRDLSDVDPTSVLNLFGILPYSVSGLPQFMSIGVWPILMGISMYVQMRLNPTPPDPIQAKVFQYMPIFFTFLLAGFPAGLVIYWTVNNLLSVLQQWWITRSMQAQAAKTN